MRKGLVSVLLVLSAIGAGTWLLQSRHRSTTVAENIHVASRPDARAEESTSRSPLEEGGPANVPADVAWAEIERTLIKDDAVDGEVERGLISADARRFSRMMDSLEATMMADPLARQFGEDYRELIAERIRMPEGQQALNLNRIACSRQLCYAQMSGADPAWSDFGRSLTDPGAEAFPTSLSSRHAYSDSTTGNVDFRFMFTTSPQTNSFRIRPTKPTRGGSR